ncbi:MAG: hypothetical protein ACLQF1_11585 [Methyloceanibacter sp.]|jgi:hypothetical protein
MKGKAKPKREGPLSVPMKFDEAIKRALTVKPPPEGWTAYEETLRKKQQRQTSKRAGVLRPTTNEWNQARATNSPFKTYFASAASVTASYSSSARWAQTDLESYLGQAAENAPLCLEGDDWQNVAHPEAQRTITLILSVTAEGAHPYENRAGLNAPNAARFWRARRTRYRRLGRDLRDAWTKVAVRGSILRARRRLARTLARRSQRG